jgi:hypothetical protein
MTQAWTATSHASQSDLPQMAAQRPGNSTGGPSCGTEATTNDHSRKPWRHAQEAEKRRHLTRLVPHRAKSRRRFATAPHPANGLDRAVVVRPVAVDSPTRQNFW